MTRAPGHRGAAARLPADRVTVPTELAALAAGVAVATIRKWASRGKLTRYGSPRRAEYDLEELHELLANCSPGQSSW
jgi:hypothetical protein